MQLHSDKTPKNGHKKPYNTVRSRSFKVTDFGTDGKPIYDFLLVNNTNSLVSRTVFEMSEIIGQVVAADGLGVPV